MTKYKHGCEAVYSTCVITESTPNPQSSLTNETCISQEQFNEDIFEQLENIQTQSDLSELGEQCLDYVLVGGKLFVKNALLKMEEEICSLKQELETLKTTAVFDTPLTGSGIDLSCLTNSCLNEVMTVKELLQALIDKSCEA